MKRHNPRTNPRAKAPKPPRAKRPRPGDGLPPGFPYPCEHAMVGRRVSGEDFAGSVIGCSTPPEGKRGRYLFVGGGAVSKAKITSAQRASAKTRAALTERWSAPDAVLPSRSPRQPPAAPGIRGLLPAPRATMPSLSMPTAPMFLPPMRRGEMAGPAWSPTPAVSALSDEELFLQGIRLSNRHAELTDTRDNPWGLFWGFANILVHRGFKLRPRYEFTEESLRAGWPSAEFRAAFDILHGGSFDFLIGSTGRVRSDKEGLDHYRRILPNFDKMLGEAVRVADSRKPNGYVGALEELTRATAYADWPNEGDISWKVGIAERSMDPSNRSEGSANSVAQKFMWTANGLDLDATLVELLSGPSENVNHARATASRLRREGQGILDGGASLIAQANDLIQNADVIRSRNVEVVPLESVRSSKTTFERNKVEPGRFLSNGFIVLDGQVKGAKADRIKTLSTAGGGGSTPQAVVAKHFAMATGSKVIPLTFGGVIRADRVNLFLVWFSDEPEMPVVFVAGDQAAIVRSSVGQWDSGGITKMPDGHGLVWFYRKGVPIAMITKWNADLLPTFDIPTLRDRLLGKRTNGPMARHRTRQRNY